MNILIVDDDLQLVEQLGTSLKRKLYRVKGMDYGADDYFPKPFSMSNFIDAHIKNLPRKFKSHKGIEVIRTIRGIGFIIDDAQ